MTMDASTQFHGAVSGQYIIAAPQASEGGSNNFHFYGPGTPAAAEINPLKHRKVTAMAADPFMVLGIASNIILVVDFTWNLLSNTKEIYNSHSGHSEDNTIVELISRDISKLTGAIVASQAPPKDICSLAEETKSLTGELLAVLGELKAKGPDERWESFKVALREVRSHDQVNAIYRKLSRLHVQVITHIQCILGDKTSDISLAVQELVETCTLLGLNMKRLVCIERSMKDILQTSKALQSNYGTWQPQALGLAAATHPPSTLRDLSASLANLGSKGSIIALEQDLLSSLYFPMIQARHEKIEKAHADTCAWVFGRSMPDSFQPLTFVEWLRERNGIFWIQGKPGCGKSTLMKFICDDPRTQEHLRLWAKSNSEKLQRTLQDNAQSLLQPTEEQLSRTSEFGDEDEILGEQAYSIVPAPRNEIATKLGAEANLIKRYQSQLAEGDDANRNTQLTNTSKFVMAKYFFWNAGLKLQKSQEGLLRSLIFEVLRQCPELVHHVRQARSTYRGLPKDSADRDASLTSAPWSVAELLAVLESMINARTSANFCFFVDGLDEYQEENRRSFRDLIHMLGHISNFPNAKICLSSRPWTVFLDAFQNVSRYSLKLEDLTRGDIHRYVLDKFEQHEQYQRLSVYDSSYVRLIDEVTTRARGVFLWVYLVVRDLLEGLTYNDTIHTMLRRLDQFPEDLEDFFQHMIDCIPRIYRRQAARTFIVTMEAPHPLLLILHSFLDDLETDPSFCIRKAQLPMDISQTSFRFERMRRQLEGRTKGLLEIVSGPRASSPYFTPRVDFLHRTVRDFLQSSQRVQLFMNDGQEQDSGLWVLMCRSVLAQIRYAPLTLHDTKTTSVPVQQRQETAMLRQFLYEFIFFARKALQDARSTSEVLNLFKGVESACLILTRHMGESGEAALVRLACSHGLLMLVEQSSYDWLELSTQSPQSEPLLRCVVQPDDTGKMYPDVVTFLLKRGADPNQIWAGRSHFDIIMSSLSSGELSAEQAGVVKVVRTLVAHGADHLIHIRQPDSILNEKLTAEQVIRNTFPLEQALWILSGSATKTAPWRGFQDHLPTRGSQGAANAESGISSKSETRTPIIQRAAGGAPNRTFRFLSTVSSRLREYKRQLKGNLG